MGRKKMKKEITALLLAVLALSYTPLASAYVGPGLGVGVVATVLGTLLGILMLLVGVIWYPLKKLFRRFFPNK